MVERTLNNIIQALECCKIGVSITDTECNVCPYNNEKCGMKKCSSLLIADAIDLLLKMKPNVMTFDEVAKNQSINDGAIWLETINGGLVNVIHEWTSECLTFLVGIPFRGYRTYLKNEEYNVKWRCWNNKTTYEQRKMARWNG